jgi:hypothetical protein
MNVSHDETLRVSGDNADMAAAMDEVDVAAVTDEINVGEGTAANGADVAAPHVQVVALQADVAALQARVAALEAQVAPRGLAQSASWDAESSDTEEGTDGTTTVATTVDDFRQTIIAATNSFSVYVGLYRVLWRPVLLGTVFITTAGAVGCGIGLAGTALWHKWR